MSTLVTEVIATIDGQTFDVVLHRDQAPKTVEYFLDVLPLTARVIHVRWSGEAVWIPLGESSGIDLPPENCKQHVVPGELALYPGGISEAEYILAYGPAAFSSKAGPLAANHFLTVVDPEGRLREIGVSTLWEGAKPIAFSRKVTP